MVPGRHHPRVPEGGRLRRSEDPGPRQKGDHTLILITKPQMKELLKNGATHYDDHRPW